MITMRSSHGVDRVGARSTMSMNGASGCMALAVAFCAYGCGRAIDSGLKAKVSGETRGSDASANADDGSIFANGEDGAPPLAMASQTEPPVIPFGLDAYRQWERWAALRIGMRAYMASTYDRAGGNEAADASHFIRQESRTSSVALDIAGPGTLVFARANHWHGSPWHYRVDGRDYVLTESSTADPTHPVAASVFLPPQLFPPPLALTWPSTRGADIMAVPIAFERGFAVAFERTHYGTGYFIYDALPEGARNVSQPPRSWDSTSPPDADVVALLGRAGADIAPQGTGVRVDRVNFDLPASGTRRLLDLDGARAIRALRFSVPAKSAVPFGRARIRITWDDRTIPSVDAPLALFFGTGTFYNRNNSPYLVKSLPVVVRFDSAGAELSTYFPMPFLRHARVDLVAAGEAVSGAALEVRSVPNVEPANHLGYFHATYVDHGTPTPGKDLLLLDTTAVEGGGPFCGHLVGTSVVFSDQAVLGTLEGDPRFYFDGSRTPQAQGTGTEEWGGGGDYWGGNTTTLPLFGHPVGAPDPASAHDSEDKIESMYRFLLADLFPFGMSARIQLEHGGNDDSVEHYRSVAFWYGLPDACLVETDSLHVGDAADEALHRYVSPTASAVEELTSRHEGGVDHVGAVEVVPTSTDTGRHMSGTTEFTLQIFPDNLGLMLRRLSDTQYPDQRAEVFVADDHDGGAFMRAGTWYAAGSNQNVYANAAGEIGPAMPVLQTVDRRFLEDEFLIPRALTEGKSAIRVRLVFVPWALPILPGMPVPTQAWSEFRYQAFAWRMPHAP